MIRKYLLEERERGAEGERERRRGEKKMGRSKQEGGEGKEKKRRNKRNKREEEKVDMIRRIDQELRELGKPHTPLGGR